MNINGVNTLFFILPHDKSNIHRQPKIRAVFFILWE